MSVMWLGDIVDHLAASTKGEEGGCVEVKEEFEDEFAWKDSEVIFSIV